MSPHTSEPEAVMATSPTLSSLKVSAEAATPSRSIVHMVGSQPPMNQRPLSSGYSIAPATAILDTMAAWLVGNPPPASGSAASVIAAQARRARAPAVLDRLPLIVVPLRFPSSGHRPAARA